MVRMRTARTLRLLVMRVIDYSVNDIDDNADDHDSTMITIMIMTLIMILVMIVQIL